VERALGANGHRVAPGAGVGAAVEALGRA